MKKYIVYWETCFNEDFPEDCGEIIIIAKNKKEAQKKVRLPFHAIIMGVREDK